MIKKRRIFIRGMSETPIYETYGPGPRSEPEKERSLAILKRLDEEQRLHPDCHVKIEFHNGEYYLSLTDLEWEKRLAQSKEIFERRVLDHHTELRKKFLY